MPYHDIEKLVFHVFPDNLKPTNQKKAREYWERVKQSPKENWKSAEKEVTEELRTMLQKRKKNLYGSWFLRKPNVGESEKNQNEPKPVVEIKDKSNQQSDSQRHAWRLKRVYFD